MRAVTQGDVIRAEARDIPRIFQLLYAGEGANRRKPLDEGIENSEVSFAKVTALSVHTKKGLCESRHWGDTGAVKGRVTYM